MKKGNWYKKDCAAGKECTGDIKVNNEGFSIKLKNGGYSFGYVCMEVVDLPSGKDIIVEPNITGDTDRLKIYAAWFESDKEIFKEYITAGKRFRVRDHADKMILTIFLNGCNGESIELSSIELKEAERVSRKCRIATVTIPYGYVWQHPQRSCEDNLKASLERIDGAVKEFSPDIVVLTENFYSRNISKDKYIDTFLTTDSVQIKSMCDKAKEHGIYICFSFRHKKNGNYYNTALLIDRKGDIIAEYNKTHLTMEELFCGMKPGSEIVTADTEFGRIGFAICWDLFFNAYADKLMNMGVEIVLNPTAGYDAKMHSQRATDTGMYIAVAGVYPDSCLIIDPEGEIIADAFISGSACAEIDPDKSYPVKSLSSGSYSERRNVYCNEAREDLYR